MLGSPATAFAAPPANDDWANAATVNALPFSDSVDLTQATNEPGEPGACGASQTAWYSFTPSSDVVVSASPAGSDFFYTDITVFQATGSGLGGLSFLTCAQFGNTAVFHAHAGTTYYILGGGLFGLSGTLKLSLDSVPSPPNDNFANATSVSSVPFTDTQDITGAGVEPGEPSPVCGGQFVGSVWYAFTPTTSGTYSTRAGTTNGGGVNVYTGSSFANLTQVACGSSATGLGSWHANAGTTYYLQAGSWFQSGQLTINVNLAPPPAVGFVWGPGDPSIFDGVQFFDQSFDPANLGIQSRQWAFGDGSSDTGSSVTHRFAKDGDYAVKLTDTTSDGRSDSATNVIHVRTHDVTLSRLVVPTSGRAGKTVQIVVKLANVRYSESAQVHLYRSFSGGFEEVATVTETVPTMNKGQTLDVKLVYTFTTADASLGKITFKANVSLLNARDALPADNDAIEAPTVVKP